MKYYVVSDTHGYYTQAIEALTDAGFFDETKPCKLVICGDLLDRGKEAIKMQDFACRMLDEEKLIFIRGNHEDLLERLLDTFNDGIAENMLRQDYFHVSNGTWDTALQLSGLAQGTALVHPEMLVCAVKATPFYKRLLPAAVDYFETEHYIFVHGWIPCATTAEKYVYRPQNDLYYDKSWREARTNVWHFARWYNGMDFCCNRKIYEQGKTIVCGHWNASYGHAVIEGKGTEYGAGADHSPFIAEGIIAIDACTYVGGKVNCVVIED